MKKIILLMLALNISLLQITNTLNASLKIEMNKNHKFAYSLNSDYVKEADTLVSSNDKESIFYPFNPFIALPVSFMSGIIIMGVFMAINPEDKADPLSVAGEAGAGYLGFAVGFIGSLTTFIVMAHKKGKEQEERIRKATLDFTMANYQAPFKSRVYFLNYRYHF